MGSGIWANNGQAQVGGSNAAGIATAPQGAQNGAVARAVPFVRAAMKSVVEGTAQSVVLSAAAQNIQLTIPAVGGWNRRVILKVSCVTAANAAAVTFAADGPWNVLTNIVFKDAAQKQIDLFVNGYHAYLMNNFGGYKPYRVDASTRGYVATAGAVGTGGSFTFFLALPQEFGRDGTGSYPNMDASQRLTVDLGININANVYGVAPTNPGTLTITPIVEYYAKPAPMNAQNQPQEQTPPAAGSMQFWRTITQVLASGQQVVTVPLSGRYLRNIIAVFTDATDVRSDTVRPTSVRLELDNNLVRDVQTQQIDQDTYRSFGLDTPTGVYPVLLGTLDPDGLAGNEWGDDYWATSTASQLVFKMSTGAAGKLFLLLNELELTGNIFR